MNFSDIEKAIGQHLEDMDDCPPIAWENKDFAPTFPYIEFRHAPTSRLDDTTDCTGPTEVGIVLLTVVTAHDTFTSQALDLGQSICDRFTKGLRLASPSGVVLIYAPSSPASGFVDGNTWRLPVRVYYMTETT